MTRSRVDWQVRGRSPEGAVAGKIYLVGKTAPPYDKTPSNTLLANIGTAQYEVAEAIKRFYWKSTREHWNSR